MDDLDIDDFFEEDYQDDDEDELSVEQMSRDAGIYWKTTPITSKIGVKNLL